MKENPDKVTGSLPDMGEYIGLHKLHSMTLDVTQVYPFGAQVTVASDGAVFNGTLIFEPWKRTTSHHRNRHLPYLRRKGLGVLPSH